MNYNLKMMTYCYQKIEMYLKAINAINFDIIIKRNLILILKLLLLITI